MRTTNPALLAAVLFTAAAGVTAILIPSIGIWAVLAIGLLLVLPQIFLSPLQSAIALIAGAPWIALAGVLVPQHQRVVEGARDVVLVLIAATLLLGPALRNPSGGRTAIAVYALAAIFIGLALFNPHLPNLSVGLVGARAWLTYPLTAVLGFAIYRTGRWQSLVRTSLLVGMPALLIGLVDAALSSAGRYGVIATAFPATQAFYNPEAGFDVGGGRLTRVSGVFPYPLAYFVFTLSMLAAAVTCYRTSIRWRKPYLLSVALASAGALTSGTRLALIVVPIMLLFGATTMRAKHVLTGLPAVALGLVGFATVTGVNVRSLPSYLSDLAVLEFEDVIVGGIRLASDVTLFGLGPGTDTNAARSLVEGNLFEPIGGRWQESLLAKSWIELGLLGLVVIVILLAGIVVMSLRARKVDRPGLSGVVVLLLCMTGILLKGSLFEQAPAGEYYWLIVGVCLAAQGNRTLPTEVEGADRATART